jgi:hypothetical protein
VRATPASFVDGIIPKEGAYGSSSTCAGDSDHCTYDYFMGNDNAACSLKSNEGVADRMPIAAPLSIAIASAYDVGTRGGTLTVTVALDASLTPPDGTVNLVTILLYEWHVGYANNSARYPRVVRASLQTKQVTVTQPGETQTFSVNYLLDAAWNAEAVGAMAFVQNYRGGPSTSPDKLVPLVVHNSAFLGDIINPPEDRHPRPVSKP